MLLHANINRKGGRNAGRGIFMFILPVVFLCNTLLFAVIMEERFKLLTTLSVSAAAVILSVISSFVIGGMFTEAAGNISNIVSVFWLLIASIFISSNNIAQKIYLALLLITNYVFITDFVPVMLGALPFGASGIGAVLIGNGIYILFSLVIMALYIKPMHYFYRRGVSPAIIILCLMQTLCWYAAAGGVNSLLGTDSFALRFFMVLMLYIFIIFAFRSIYGGAKYKARDIQMSADDAVMDIQADNFNAMMVHVESFKSVKKNINYVLKKIALLADAGKTKEISDYVAVSVSNNNVSPILANYCDDKYVNAVMATKTAEAENRGIRVESNISIGEMGLKTIQFCIIINDLMTAMINDSEKAREDKFIRLNMVTGEGQLTIEAINAQGVSEEKTIREKTAFDLIKDFFEEEEESGSDLKNIREIVETHSGKIHIAHSGGETITRIEINY